MKQKTIEQKYKNLDEIDHVLLRHDMYVGSKTPKPTSTPVISGNMLEWRDIEYTPALLKIIDEILSNSTDEHGKNIKSRNLLSTKLQKSFHILDKIEVTAEGGRVTVKDNGGIPVEYHNDAKTYLPTLLFGSLRAGSNFDDNEGRTSTGKNGVGISLTNIFSTRFEVTTCDGEAEFNQVWTNNSKDVSDVSITLLKRHRYDSDAYPTDDVWYKKDTKFEKKLNVNLNAKVAKLHRGTEIKFDIDFDQFDEDDCISPGMMMLLEYRCIVAAAASPGLEVIFNGTSYKFNSFIDYVKLFTDDHKSIIHEKNDEWEFCILPTLINQGFKSHSFVNGNSCNEGTHVDHLNRYISNHLSAWVKKKKKFDVNKNQIVKQFDTFINLKVVNPLYTSQTKERLDTPHGKYHGGDDNVWPRVGDKTFNRIEHSAVIENLILLNERNDSAAEKKQLANKNKEMSRRNVKTIRKLTDANNKNRSECELWMYEGASAANTFIGVREAKKHASYELKGKVMNTLYAKQTTIANNTELSEIMQASGLRFNNEYDINKLRYKRWIIATDADVDGVCITGQLLTFFHKFFPDLIAAGRVFSVMSPRYKVIKRKGKKVTYCYSEEEFQNVDKKNCDIEYFKGLGSLEEEEYSEMVNNPRLVQFYEDENSELAFETWMGNNADLRKKFLEE